MSRDLSRLHPSRTPSATAFVSCLISAVAFAARSLTSSGVFGFVEHPQSGNTRRNGRKKTELDPVFMEIGMLNVS